MESLWDKVVSFHGHACPGLAQGLRASLLAMKLLDVTRDEDEELVVVTENDACGVDAIQWVTGCTAGKGNLVFLNYGKSAYTFYSRAKKRGVRIVMEKVSPPQTGEYQGMSESEKRAEAIKQLLSMSLEEGMRVEEVEVLPPKPARIFDSVTCQVCGERVMEPRARIKGGQVVCLPCSDPYRARWDG